MVAQWPFNRSMMRAANGQRLIHKNMRRTGAPMPMLGLSTEGMDPCTAARAVEAGLRVGFTFFDVAESDGQEREVGRVLDAALDAGMDRLELFMMYRMVCNAEKATERVTGAIDSLQIGYLDIVLPQWTVDHTQLVETVAKDADAPAMALPKYDHKAFMELWRTMESWVPPKGRITRHLGVSNIIKEAMDAYLKDCKSTLDVVYNEAHLLMQMNGTKQVCDLYDVPFVAHTIDPPSVGEVKLVQQACASKKLTPLELSVKWSIQRQVPCVVNSADPAVLEAAFAAASLPENEVLLLRAAEMQALQRVDKGLPARTLRPDDPHLWDVRYAIPKSLGLRL
eukprot:TRINITY_DN14579_c0_g1_i1.p2 TRINITY_DN14579_c0_g1~~TRINITY_DN14579_c0_g1_i1.p2  ORF type:complete len:338 (+),score=119.21 TRINITY_DN14579_c0_g1_i1:79-1092(+)